MLTAAQSPSSTGSLMEHSNVAPEPRRKRKAQSQDNERLSKRLSLLNIERDGTKLYVPVERPKADAKPHGKVVAQASNEESMQLDDTKHKVYIYNIDDELSSESESEEGKLIFLPDIEKRLRETRIPPSVLANPDGELAGMQLVLYSDPRSISVPEEKDGVRKAILDARRRLRNEQFHQGDSAINGDYEKPFQNSRSESTSDSVYSENDAMDMD